MSDPVIWAMVTGASFGSLVVVSVTALKGWREWIALQRGLLDSGGRNASPANPTGARIELADLKERVRKLEAIAAGVDL